MQSIVAPVRARLIGPPAVTSRMNGPCHQNVTLYIISYAYAFSSLFFLHISSHASSHTLSKSPSMSPSVSPSPPPAATFYPCQYVSYDVIPQYI